MHYTYATYFVDIPRMFLEKKKKKMIYNGYCFNMNAFSAGECQVL